MSIHSIIRMKPRQHFNYQSGAIALLMVLMHSVSANDVTPLSLSTTEIYTHNDTNRLQSFNPEQPLNDLIRFEKIKTEINALASIFPLIKPKPNYRNRRGIISPPSSTNITSNRFTKVENEINLMKTELARLKESASLSAEVKDSIKVLESSVAGFQISLDALKLAMTQQNEEFQKQITIFVEKFDAWTTNNLVENIRSRKFSFTTQQFQLSEYNIRKKIVHEIYNNQADNFDLLMSFGATIQDGEIKFNLYDTLHDEMKTNDHKDAEKLFKLYDALKKEILQRSTGTIVIETQSLIDILWNEIQEAAVKSFSSAFLNDDSWTRFTQLNNDIYLNNHTCLSNIYHKVVDNVMDKMKTENLLDKVRQHLTYFQEYIAFDEAVMRKLERDNQLNTDSAKVLAYYIKSTILKYNYNETVSQEWKSKYENIIDRLPQNLKNTFFFIICKKNPKCKEREFALNVIFSD